MSKQNSLLPIYTADDLSLSENCLLNKKQLQFIYKSTPPDQIYRRPAKGGGEWSYVKGSYAKKVLNLMFGFNWSLFIDTKEYDLNIGQVFVVGRLVIPLPNGQQITKTQAGRADIKFKTEWIKDEVTGKSVKQTTDIPLDLGNDIKAAITDCLKKCCSELGLFSDIYSEEELQQSFKVIDEDDMLTEIKLIMESESLVISEEDRLYIERIIDNEEKVSYRKVMTVLNKAIKRQTEHIIQQKQIQQKK